MARMKLERREAEPAGGALDALRDLARPLETDADLDPLLDRIGEARFVLLGEASHGTHEFYEWRARISKRLIAEKGFSFIAVEGDWPDFERLDDYVAGRGSERRAAAVLRTFQRWPTWMWANEEIGHLVEWLRASRERTGRAVGLHGLDVYSLWQSMEAVVRYLDKVDPNAARDARRAYECFAPFGNDAHRYAYAVALTPATCEDEVVRALVGLRQSAPAGGDTHYDHFKAEQNAIVAKNAERYYRTMIGGGASSWNVRDEHMADTLDRLVDYYGAGSKAIVWAHNTHVGDARYTDMAEAGEHNIGEMVRLRHAAEGVVLVGFSTNRGTVIAGREWDAPMRVMPVPAGRPDSFEDLFSRLGRGDALFLFDPVSAPSSLLERRGHRAIGVVYHPEYERLGNYVPTVLPRRYDALLYSESTRALEALVVRADDRHEPAETFPYGV
jgi:erythromycin esterase-like protein